MTLLGRIALVLMLFVIFMFAGALAQEQFAEKSGLLAVLIWTFSLGAGLFIMYGKED